MTVQSVAGLAPRHCLRSTATLITAGTKMQNRLTPVAETLLDECGDGIDFQSLRTPAKDTIRRGIATSNDIDPK